MDAISHFSDPRPVVVHIPHSSVFIPEESLESYSRELIPKELSLMTDLFCNEIFDIGFTSEVFLQSRLFCDVERFRSDEDEEMSALGMGVCYTLTSDGKTLRRLRSDEKEAILCDDYDTHHKILESLVRSKLESHHSCLIIDGHSFSNVPLAHERDQNPSRPDICLGTDSCHTPPSLAEHFRTAFENSGLKVKFNSPFAGTMVPVRYYHRNSDVFSIMIEINRCLYLHSDGTKDQSSIKFLNKLIREATESALI
ncbi:MAG: N-formylglutamate amidohydrolase [Candidatus Cloacimonetes bacterium]|nr:N-formylglutamate amidohydrolase [Candidatus Cloacimonadota bacterium]